MNSPLSALQLGLRRLFVSSVQDAISFAAAPTLAPFELITATSKGQKPSHGNSAPRNHDHQEIKVQDSRDIIETIVLPSSATPVSSPFDLAVAVIVKPVPSAALISVSSSCSLPIGSIPPEVAQSEDDLGTTGDTRIDPTDKIRLGAESTPTSWQPLSTPPASSAIVFTKAVSPSAPTSVLPLCVLTESTPPEVAQSEDDLSTTNDAKTDPTDKSASGAESTSTSWQPSSNSSIPSAIVFPEPDPRTTNNIIPETSDVTLLSTNNMPTSYQSASDPIKQIIDVQGSNQFELQSLNEYQEISQYSGRCQQLLFSDLSLFENSSTKKFDLKKFLDNHRSYNLSSPFLVVDLSWIRQLRQKMSIEEENFIRNQEPYKCNLTLSKPKEIVFCEMYQKFLDKKKKQIQDYQSFYEICSDKRKICERVLTLQRQKLD